jgi:site-specific recombinase XerD
MPVSNALLISNFVGYLKYECAADEKSIAAHERSLTHLKAWLAPVWLPEATRIMLQLYIADSLSQGTSARTVACRLRHFWRFYQFLLNDKVITSDPSAGLSMPRHCAKTKAKEPQSSATIVTWLRMDFEAY